MMKSKLQNDSEYLDLDEFNFNMDDNSFDALIQKTLDDHDKSGNQFFDEQDKSSLGGGYKGSTDLLVLGGPSKSVSIPTANFGKQNVMLNNFMHQKTEVKGKVN